MEPEADFDLNMWPLKWEEERTKARNAGIFELEAITDRMMVTTRKKKRNIEVIMFIIYFNFL